jgi:hypothetical protein
MALKDMLVEVETAVMLDTPKVAVSDDPLGTVGGVQLAAVFQSLFTGLRFQVALPPNALPAAASRSINMAAARKYAGAHRRRCKGIIFLISLRSSEIHRFCMILIAITSSCASEPCRSRFFGGKTVRGLAGVA